MFKFLSFIFQILGIINIILMIADVFHGYYGWALISALSAVVCYVFSNLTDSIN